MDDVERLMLFTVIPSEAKSRNLLTIVGVVRLEFIRDSDRRSKRTDEVMRRADPRTAWRTLLLEGVDDLLEDLLSMTRAEIVSVRPMR